MFSSYITITSSMSISACRRTLWNESCTEIENNSWPFQITSHKSYRNKTHTNIMLSSMTLCSIIFTLLIMIWQKSKSQIWYYSDFVERKSLILLSFFALTPAWAVAQSSQFAAFSHFITREWVTWLRDRPISAVPSKNAVSANIKQQILSLIHSFIKHNYHSQKTPSLN